MLNLQGRVATSRQECPDDAQTAPLIPLEPERPDMPRMIVGARAGFIALLVAIGLIVATSTTPVAATGVTTATSVAQDVTAAAGSSDGTAFQPAASLFAFDTGRSQPVAIGGLTVWPNASDGVSYAARTVPGGTQQFVDIAGAQAPTRFSGKVAAGYTAIAGPNGLVLIVNDNTRIGMPVPAPWAYDATGKAVATHYEITNGGKGFVQVVDHRVVGITYPVVADPVFVWNWGTANWLLNKAETNNLAGGTGLLVVVGAWRLPAPQAKVVGAIGGGWQVFAGWVQGQGKCLAFGVNSLVAYPYYYGGWPCV